MRYLLILFLVLTLGCPTVSGSNIQTPPIIGGGSVQEQPMTDKQHRDLQLDIDIFTMCLVGEVPYWASFGFTSEFIVSRAFEGCEQEGQNLVDTMKRIELNQKEQQTVVRALFGTMVQAVDKVKNKKAMEWFQKEKKKNIEI